MQFIALFICIHSPNTCKNIRRSKPNNATKLSTLLSKIQFVQHFPWTTHPFRPSVNSSPLGLILNLPLHAVTLLVIHPHTVSHQVVWKIGVDRSLFRIPAHPAYIFFRLLNGYASVRLQLSSVNNESALTDDFSIERSVLFKVIGSDSDVSGGKKFYAK